MARRGVTRIMRVMKELAFEADTGGFVRLVDDDGLAEVEWIFVDPSQPHRSTTLAAADALKLVRPEDRLALAWSALCCALLTGGSSPASLRMGDLELLDARDREALRWWLGLDLDHS